MIETNPDTPRSDVEIAADLGRRDAERGLTPYDIESEGSLLVSRIRHDEQVIVTDLERYRDAPNRARGSVAIHDPSDFARYIKRIADSDITTVWADIDQGTVTGLLDDHELHGAGWRSHTVRLALQPDPDWDAWIRRDNKLLTQLEFAEFLEQQMHTIVQPAAADILDVATTLQAKRNVTFNSSAKMKNGDIKFTFNEETKASAGAKGELEIPDEFTLRLAPFAYTPPVELTAKLRYRIVEHELRVGYKLIRAAEVRRDAFSAIVGEIRGLLGEEFQVFLGTTPRLS